MQCCKHVWKLPYTCLRTSSSIAATSSTMACLSSWTITIRLQNTRSFRNPHRKKFGTVSLGDRASQAMSLKLRTQVTHCCTFQRSIATDHMKWRPLLYRSSSRQPRQAIAPAQYSNLKCVSQLCATLYIYIYICSYLIGHTYPIYNSSVFFLDAWNINVSFHDPVQAACTALYPQVTTHWVTSIYKLNYIRMTIRTWDIYIVYTRFGESLAEAWQYTYACFKFHVHMIGVMHIYQYIKVKSSAFTGLEWPRGFQEVKVSRFHDKSTGWC